MKSEEKIHVTTRLFPEYGDKPWVVVDFRGKTDWVPSFEDLFRIIQAICQCEDEKYPPPAEGRGMVSRFVLAACSPVANWEILKARFKIPER